MHGIRLWLLASAAVSACLLAGCSSGQRLSLSMASISHEYGLLQDRALVLNILRRSFQLPAHFTTLMTVRGYNRATAGANLSIPFGADAPAQFQFSPNLSIQQGPSFDVSMQDNKEFYRAYVAPVTTETINYYLRQNHPQALILSLFIDRISLKTPEAEEVFVNDPEDGAAFEAFQAFLSRLIDQGLTAENAQLSEAFGPASGLEQPPSYGQLISARKEKLDIRDLDNGRYQLQMLVDSARFCFLDPQEPLFRQAVCRTRSGGRGTFLASDATFFGSMREGEARFEDPKLGAIRIRLRSLAEIFDYLGEIVRVQRETGALLQVRTRAGPQPVLVVQPGEIQAPELATITAEFRETDYSVPTGAAGGQSGTVLTILSHLLALSQSVEDLPTTRTFTIFGE